MTTLTPPEVAHQRLTEHTEECQACLDGALCLDGAQLHYASTAAQHAAMNECADCGARKEAVGHMVARFFPGMSGPGGPAIPLCAGCTKTRADQAQRQIEEWAARVGGRS